MLATSSRALLTLLMYGSMSVNSACVVGGARRVGPPPLKIPRSTPVGLDMINTLFETLCFVLTSSNHTLACS